VYWLDFHANINEMHSSRSKIPSENLVRKRCAEGFNSGVKGLIFCVSNSKRVDKRSSAQEAALTECPAVVWWYEDILQQHGLLFTSV
jgi:hypothetical protein